MDAESVKDWPPWPAWREAREQLRREGHGDNEIDAALHGLASDAGQNAGIYGTVMVYGAAAKRLAEGRHAQNPKPRPLAAIVASVAPSPPVAETKPQDTGEPAELWDNARLQEIEDKAGFRRSHLTPAERRIRSYIVREIKRRGHRAVQLRTGKIAAVLRFHPNTVRHARDFLCDRKAGKNGNGPEGIGYLRVIRHSLGDAWLVTLGWQTAEELQTVADRLLERRPTRPRRGRKLEPSCDPTCNPSCNPSCNPDPTSNGLESQAAEADNDRRSPLSTDLRIYGSTGSTEKASVESTAAATLLQPKAAVRKHDHRWLCVSPGESLRVWCDSCDGDDAEMIEEIVALAERMKLDEAFVQMIVQITYADFEEILSYFRKAAYGPDIENPGGWLRQTLRKVYTYAELGESI
jgi:hypothetical protein